MSCRGCRTGIALDAKLALQYTYDNMRDRGAPVIFKLNTESTILRDMLNNIKQRNIGIVDGSILKVNSCSTSINYTGQRNERFATGLKDDTGLNIRVPALTFYQLGLNTDELEDIDLIRARVIYRNATYEIAEMSLQSQYGDVYLYIDFTLKRE